MRRFFMFAPGSHLGEITGVRTAECRGGGFTGALALPWELTFASFQGELPNNLTRILFAIDGVAFDLSLLGGLIECLYGGDAGMRLEVLPNGGNEYRTWLADLLSAIQLPKVSGSVLCEREVDMLGVTLLTPRQDLVV